jgi:hypothetical protein
MRSMPIGSAHRCIWGLRGRTCTSAQWDLLLEGRVMHKPEADTTDFGALAAVYRHIGDNFKVGIGYNFGRFSDDLRDLTLDDRGVFPDAIGKL